jgi:hypothetical protein
MTLKFRAFSRCLSSSIFALTFIAIAGYAQTPAHRTKNVVLVMMDGLRWQEVFHGADDELINTPGPKAYGAPKERADYARKLFGTGSADERREALMPFLWSVVAKNGQLYGNRELGSESQVTNGFNFSYPGYNETLTGYGDPRIKSNDNIPNPNITVFEWLNKRPGFEGKVAAFGAWENFNGIFNKERCGFVVNAGYDPLTEISTPEITLLNQLKAEAVRVWPDEAFDPLPFHTAIEYIKVKKPRVVFIGLGETDDWAHFEAYPEYLNAAHRDDAYLAALWSLLQSMPEYKDQTTLIALPDHGRGVGAQWTSHWRGIEASRETWMAFLGPDTAALGERKEAGPVTESQIAATIAALLGEDYHADVPKSGAPIKDVLAK